MRLRPPVRPYLRHGTLHHPPRVEVDDHGVGRLRDVSDERHNPCRRRRRRHRDYTGPCHAYRLRPYGRLCLRIGHHGHGHGLLYALGRGDLRHDFPGRRTLMICSGRHDIHHVLK